MRFENGRWYRLRLRVTEERIQFWVDDNRAISFATAGHTLAATHAEMAPFGVYNFHSSSALRNIRLRLLKPEADAKR